MANFVCLFVLAGAQNTQVRQQEKYMGTLSHFRIAHFMHGICKQSPKFLLLTKNFHFVILRKYGNFLPSLDSLLTFQ